MSSTQGNRYSCQHLCTANTTALYCICLKSNGITYENICVCRTNVYCGCAGKKINLNNDDGLIYNNVLYIYTVTMSVCNKIWVESDPPSVSVSQARSIDGCVDCTCVCD